MSTSTTGDRERTVEALIPIWAELLGADAHQVSETTDFFASGGHSLTAMLLVARVECDLGISAPLSAVVNNSTVSSFATYLIESGHAPAADGSVTKSERLLQYHQPERTDLRNQRFETYYATAMGSEAHAEFCRQVYGDNFGQHGMADLSQIDRLLDVLNPGEGDVVLDMGCGYGLISQYIAERTGAHVVGVDLSPSAIEYANTLAAANDRLQFHVMDIGDLKFPRGTFTHIVSIDTIYYAPSLAALLDRFRRMGTEAMRLGIIRTFPIRSFTKDTWNPALTELATQLTRTFGEYEAIDLSREENEHWQKKVDVLDSLRERFIEEGNEELFGFRYAEAAHEAGIEQFRYLFAAGHR